MRGARLLSVVTQSDEVEPTPPPPAWREEQSRVNNCSVAYVFVLLGFFGAGVFVLPLALEWNRMCTMELRVGITLVTVAYVIMLLALAMHHVLEQQHPTRMFLRSLCLWLFGVATVGFVAGGWLNATQISSCDSLPDSLLPPLLVSFMISVIILAFLIVTCIRQMQNNILGY